jgi:hypothetical protein
MSNILSNRILSRRTVLRGLGTALALPWLEAMMPRSARASAAGKPPVRMAFIHVPNGIVTRRLQDGKVLNAAWTPEGRLDWRPGQGGVLLPAWTPEAVGALPGQLPSLLDPLADFRDDFSIITGLANAPGRAGLGHGPAQGAYTTCARPNRTTGNDYRAGTSVDQVAANHLGDRTRLPSLQVGTGDSGAIEGYMSSLSWRDATTPLQLIANPRHVFDRLFATDSGRAGAQREAERSSILDFIREEAGSLQTNLGANDRRKLDEYFTSIRDIEQRIERNARMPVAAPPGGFAVPDAKAQFNWAEHVRLLGDLMTLAFQTDTTRICTFVFANEFSGASYPYAGINDSHHHVSHHGDKADHIAATARINLHMLEQFAYLLRKLKETKEGEGTLLDNCMISYGSGNSDGNQHSKSNLPVLLAGRGGGSLQPGRHVRFAEETPLANLWLSMLDRFGTKTGSFGDSTGRLSGL